MAHLTDLPNLKSLSLDDTKITDAGLLRLRGLMKLERLVLANTQVSDAGMAHLTDLPNLKSLSLDETNISDASITSFEKMPALRLLIVYETQITDEGAAELHRALPGVLVFYKFGAGPLVDHPDFEPRPPAPPEEIERTETRGRSGEEEADS